MSYRNRASGDFGDNHLSDASNGKNRRSSDEDYNQKQVGRTRLKAIQDSSRYEHDPPSLKDREKDKRGKLIRFCKNNDPLFAGITVSLSNKMFPTFESLLEHLNTKIPTPTGVRCVFSCPDFDEVTNLTEFESGPVYIVSSTRKVAKQIDYGAIVPAGGKGKSGEPNSKSRRRSNNKSTSSLPSKIKPPLKLRLISNLARDSCETMILNPKTTQNFEDLVTDLGSLLKIPKEPASALFMADEPYKKIESFSQLNRLLEESDEEYNTFFVCGDEEIPIELMRGSGKKNNPDTRSDTRSRHRSKRPRKQDENEPPTPRYRKQDENEQPMPRYRKQDENEAPTPRYRKQDENEQPMPRYRKQDENEAPTPRYRKQDENEQPTPRYRKQDENEAPTPRYRNEPDEPSPRAKQHKDTRKSKSRRSVANLNQRSMQSMQDEDEESEEEPEPEPDVEPDVEPDEEEDGVETPRYERMNHSEDEDDQI
ncbi:hypothetical protein ScPMuIL_014722 [Solemya velum]